MGSGGQRNRGVGEDMKTLERPVAFSKVKPAGRAGRAGRKGGSAPYLEVGMSVEAC